MPRLLPQNHVQEADQAKYAALPSRSLVYLCVLMPLL